MPLTLVCVVLTISELSLRGEKKKDGFRIGEENFLIFLMLIKCLGLSQTLAAFPLVAGC